ncbi:hypothetical protein A4X09_0g5386 [Tilletia walkeri]|uniref:Uncharacterized protein n=1 Tax=Tilletia walkeri TaxID=117179 RepID=A0A8X7N782_9BASI|nr:hypothetical protein A4X09_0g5386 [Tilletia walkeri]
MDYLHHLEQRAIREDWPSADDINDASFEDVLFGKPDSKCHEVIDLLHQFPPSSDVPDLRSPGPLGPTSHFVLIMLAREQFKKRRAPLEDLGALY